TVIHEDQFEGLARAFHDCLEPVIESGNALLLVMKRDDDRVLWHGSLIIHLWIPTAQRNTASFPYFPELLFIFLNPPSGLFSGLSQLIQFCFLILFRFCYKRCFAIHDLSYYCSSSFRLPLGSPAGPAAFSPPNFSRILTVRSSSSLTS